MVFDFSPWISIWLVLDRSFEGSTLFWALNNRLFLCTRMDEGYLFFRWTDNRSFYYIADFLACNFVNISRYIPLISQRQKKVKFSISFLDHLVRCFKKTKYTTRCSMKSSTIYKEQIMLQLQFYWWKWIKFWSTNFWNFEKKMIFFVASKISGTEFCLFWKQ